jgi:hypothetical protein
MQMRMKKEDLLKALEALRPLIEEMDAKVMAAHKAEEEETLKTFHNACRIGLTWDYATLKKHHFDLQDDKYQRLSHRGPTCPRPMIHALTSAVYMISHSSQKVFTVQPTGYTSEVYKLLMLNAPKPEAAC